MNNCKVLALMNELHYEQEMQKLMILKYRRDAVEVDNQEEAVGLTLLLSSNWEHIRAPDYYEEWLQNYLDTDFFSNFRMCRDTFVNLLDAINCPDRKFGGGEHPVSIEKCLLMFFWWLGKGDTLISISDRFNVAVSTVYNTMELIIPKILQLQEKYIPWPNQEEAVTIERAFKAKSGYPGVIGAADGCNVVFECPNLQQESYIDKNRNHSIKLQGIGVGFPGSAHDSRVFQNSQIYHDVENNGMMKKYFYDDYHLIGDKAYPLRKWIITPYKDERHLDDIQRYHNTNHSKTRIVVDHTFDILKSRWKILKAINVNSIEKAVKIITVSCILHTFCYVNSDIWKEFQIIERNYDRENNINMQRDGRDHIATNLWRDHP